MTIQELKNKIQSYIKSNGKREITGAKLQEVLLDSVDTLNSGFTSEKVGDGETVELMPYVEYVSQSLTEAQKAVARRNIGVESITLVKKADVANLPSDINWAI